MIPRLQLARVLTPPRRVLPVLIAIAGPILVSVSLFATAPDSTPAGRSEKAWPVSVMRVSPGTARPSFSAWGRLESSRITHLKTDLDAGIADVHIREGDWVEAGDMLVSLDDAEFALVVEERRAELERLESALASIDTEAESLAATTDHFRAKWQSAQKKLERHQNLMSRRLISQALLDEVTALTSQAHIDYQAHLQALADLPHRHAAAEAALRRARAQLRLAELDLEKTRIRAPFRGLVLGVFVAPGDRSGVGATLVDMAAADAFEVRVEVPARYSQDLSASLTNGRPVTAASASGLELALSRLSGRVRPGHSSLDAFFGPAPGTRPSDLILGALLELTIQLPEESGVVTVPVQAVYDGGRLYAVQAAAHRASAPAPDVDADADDHGESPATEYRLRAVPIERVGEFRDADGRYLLLVRSPELRAGAQIVTSQLPRAVTGLLVAPVSVDENSVRTLAATGG